MRLPLKGYIADQEAAYIELLFGAPDPRGKENGLERLCLLYRRGYRLKNPHPVQQVLNALLYNEDANVRRWTLNAIALLGTRRDNLQATLDAVDRDRGNEDVLGAGIAAVVALTQTQPDDLVPLLAGVGVPLEGATLLAAAQQTDAYQGKLAANRINTDTATDAELRLATVLIGLDKAPEHLFHLSHENRAVIGSLNRHHDPSVAQYSVWAICESDVLRLSDLGVLVADLESLPDNVRGYVLRLITADAETAGKHMEYIAAGADDRSEKARLGLAMGLRHVYFDGLPDLTADWLGREISEGVKGHVLDHMAAHADRSPPYEDAVKTAYALAGTGSIIRYRLESAAAGKPIYSDLRRIALRGDNANLFDAPLGGTILTQNFNAQNMNIGAVAGDHAMIENAVGAMQNNAQGAQDALALMATLLEKSGTTGAELDYGKDLIAAAQKEPSKITLTKAVGWLKQIKDGAAYAITAGHEFHVLYDKLEKILPFLPS